MALYIISMCNLQLASALASLCSIYNKWVILATTVQIPSVMAVMNLASTLYRIAPTRFLPLEHHTAKTDLVHGINIPTSKGTGHSPIFMASDIGDVSTGCSPTTVPNMTEAAVSQGTPHACHPAMMAAHTLL